MNEIRSTGKRITDNRESPRPSSKRMIPWKQALVTAAAVYPLLLSYEWLVKQLLPVQHIDRRITLLIVVLMIASTMVFILMPLIIRMLGKWLTK